MLLFFRELLACAFAALLLATTNVALAAGNAQTGEPVELQLLEELLADRENFSIDAILQIIKTRGVTFELGDTERRRLAASAIKGKRDESLIEPVLKTAASACNKCAPKSSDCVVAKMVRDRSTLAALYEGLSKHEYKFAGGARVPELILASVPQGSPVPGGMLAVLCRAGATESRILQVLNQSAIETPDDDERARIADACPKRVVERVQQLLAPPCADGQHTMEVTAANLQPWAVNGQFDIRLSIDDYTGIQISGDTVCVEVLNGAQPAPSRNGPMEYHRGPLPRRHPSTWELNYAVVEGPPPNVQVSVVPARVSRSEAEAIRVLIKDLKKGRHDYHVRLLWALKPFTYFDSLDLSMQNLWRQEFTTVLHAVQQRGLAFPWSDAITNRLKELQVPADVISDLSAVRRLECDTTPYSAGEFQDALKKSVEQYTNRATNEISSRGVTAEAGAKFEEREESPVWNSSVLAAIRQNIRTDNRPGSWPKQ